jgi:hypothetical protein
MAAFNYSWGQSLGCSASRDNLKTLCGPLLPVSLSPSLLPVLTLCSWPCPPSGGGANEQWNGQRCRQQGGARKTKWRSQEPPLSTNSIFIPLIELVEVIKVLGLYNHKCLTAISYRQKVPVRYLKMSKSMDETKQPTQRYLAHKKQGSLFQSGVQGVSLNKMKFCQKKMWKYLCQILKSLELRIPWFKNILK